jgi:hypothetical protein
MSNRIPSTLSVAAVVAVLATASPAHAYLDPSTGSMLLSAVIGVLATAALVLKTFWYRIRALFRHAGPPPDGSARPATSRPAEGDRHAPP